MSAVGRIHPTRLREFSFAEEQAQPQLEGLAGEFQCPTRHLDGAPVASELVHVRIEPFPADEPAGDRRPRDGTLQLLTRGAFPTAGLPKFVVLCAFLAEPGIERPDTDAEAVRDLSDCRLRASTQRDPDDVVQASKPNLA